MPRRASLSGTGEEPAPERRSSLASSEAPPDQNFPLYGAVFGSRTVKDDGSGTGGHRCCHGKSVIIPDSDNFWYSAWECFIFLLLGLSCYVVPLEVVLSKNGQKSAFSLVSMIVDVSFTIDMCLIFFTAYERPATNSSGGVEWEENKCLIARRYCALPFSGADGHAGWFWIDLVATGPRMLSALVTTTTNTNRDAHGMKAMAMLRALRLLRFLRLHRMDRLSYYVMRVNVNLGLSPNVLEIIKSTLYVTLACHWLSCLWVGVECVHWRGIFFELWGGGELWRESWLSHLIKESGDPCHPSAEEDGGCVYMLAMYWTIITVTSVGYGDIVPRNHTEYVISVFATLIMALVWAYVIATIVSIVSSFKKSAYSFNQQMDDLNAMCAGRNVPHELCVQLRDYMTMSSHLPKQMAQIKMMTERLSDGLQDKVAEVTRGRFLKVWWISDLPDAAKHELTRRMTPHFYGIQEDVFLFKTLICVRDGWLKVNGLRILGHGDLWGEVDVLLESEGLVRDHLRTQTFVDAVALKQGAIREVCLMFPHVDSRIRRAQIRCAVFRAFVLAAQRQRTSRWWSAVHNGGVVTELRGKRYSFVDSAPFSRSERFVESLDVQLSSLVSAQEQMAKDFEELQEELEGLVLGKGGVTKSGDVQSPAPPPEKL